MRSSKRTDEFGAFLRRLPLAALAAVLIWFAVRPVYYPALCSVAQFVERIYEVPKVAQITPDRDGALLGRSDLRSDSARVRLSLTQVSFNLIPFLALVFALPGALKGRGWRAFATGLGLVAASHVLGLIIHLRFFYVFSLGAFSRATYSDLERNVVGAMRIFYDIPITFALPLLLWVGLFSDRVFALLGLSATPRTGA
jgi:hypothetical protein